MRDIRARRRSGGFMGLSIVYALVMAGCAQQPSLPPDPCRTLDCVVGQSVEAEIDACATHLFWYERYPRDVRNQIDSTYQYPAKSTRSWRTMQQLGMRVPSPKSWCETQAHNKLGTALAKRMW